MRADINKLTLTQVVKFIEYIHLHGYDCWIEGNGNGTVKLVIQEKSYTIQ
jgi:hypothetical protein